MKKVTDPEGIADKLALSQQRLDSAVRQMRDNMNTSYLPPIEVSADLFKGLKYKFKLKD